jgi:hypothetical protein
MLIEQPGAWGHHALTESRFPKDIASKLQGIAREVGFRIVLIRRGARLASARRNVYFGRTHKDGSWLAHVDVERAEEILELDLGALARGSAPDGTRPVDHPLFLVCTHGRHDACCSVRGNQVSRLACSAYPGMAWECSHIGGDRFAANVVCFPDGVYYGRVGPAELIDLLESYRRGWLNLQKYRGRSSYAFAVQAAEYFVRLEHGVLTLGGLELTGVEADAGGGETATRFRLPDGRTAGVTVRTSRSGERDRLTCRAQNESAIPLYEIVSSSIA